MGIILQRTNNIFYKTYILSKLTNIIPISTISPIATQPLEFIKIDIVSYNVPGCISNKYIVYFIYIVIYIY